MLKKINFLFREQSLNYFKAGLEQSLSDLKRKKEQKTTLVTHGLVYENEY